MKTWLFFCCVMSSMILSVHAAMVEYGGHYYAFVQTYGTWDQVNTAANAQTMSIEGTTYAGHLWTLSSQNEYTSVRSNLGLSQWEIVWIGARNVDNTYTWVNNEGAVNFSGWIGTLWSSPNTSDYGTSMGGSGYGYEIGTQTAATSCQYIIEYEAIPEPTGVALIAVGLAALALKRRKLCC